MTQPLWRQILRTNFRKVGDLAAFLHLDPKLLLVRRDFPLNIPRRLAEKIEKGNIDDPLLRQFVPLHEEEQWTPDFLEDAVGDGEARCGSKLLRKYRGRLLLMPTGACPVHCRFCFRQHFDYDASEIDLQAIKEDTSLREAILSGGDPLSCDDEWLASLIARLDTIPHLRRLRFHTRFPICIPERITDHFVSVLRGTRLQVWFIVHTNHPRELDDAVLHALQKIPAPVLSQTVLLKGVNDDLPTLKALFERLVDEGITPYYLHHPDRVQGTAHFHVTLEKGLHLMESLRHELSGYAVPRYVQEVAHEPSKRPLDAVPLHAVHCP